MNAQPLEVYMYYARLERTREDADERPVPDSPWTVFGKRVVGRKDRIVYPYGPPGPSNSRLRRLMRRISGKSPQDDSSKGEANSPSSDPLDYGSRTRLQGRQANPTTITDDWKGADIREEEVGTGPGLLDVLTPPERQTAYRLLRVASWQLVFFLITTDVLGWYTAPMAFAQLGYGPGVLVYTFFYLLAFASGQILWRMYMSMDSEMYPVKVGLPSASSSTAVNRA